MSLNLQNLIDKINTRVAGIDSATSLNDIIRLTELNTRISGSMNQGAIQYRSQNQLPAVSLSDSASGGQITFVADDQIDSDGRFYFRSRGGWINLQTATDSDENYSIANPSAGGGEPAPDPFVYQGDVKGVIFSARNPGTPTYPGDVQTVSFTSDAPATDAADLLTGGYGGGGYGDGTYGYVAGGAPDIFRIERAPYTSLTTLTDIGDLTKSAQYMAPSNDETHGYVAGGYRSPPAGYSNYIDRFSFAATTVSNEVGTLSPNPTGGLSSGSSSTTHGYHAGGIPYTNQILKFPFAASATSTDVGDLTVTRRTTAGSSSTTHGYAAQGHAPPYSNVIDKWPFASDGNATDVGDAQGSKRYSGGMSSTTHGYHAGGYGPTYFGGIGKYSFSSDGDATSVGSIIATGDFLSSGGSND